MDEFEYSLDALNAKSAFYRASTMVYVEGDEDLLFWEGVFSKVPDFSVKVESVGGAPELDKYIERIDSGELHAIAARDADYLRVIGMQAKSDRVIYTVGYAIENTIYTPDVLFQLARAWCKSNAVSLAQCSAWLNGLSSAFTQLIALDIANALSKSGVKVLDDNCARFMKSQCSPIPCPNKITAHQAAVSQQLPKKAIAKGLEVISSSPTASLENLRGHLLASAVMKFVVHTAKVLGKKIHVSADSLYAAAITHFSHAFAPAHPHHAYYLARASTAAASFG